MTSHQPDENIQNTQNGQTGNDALDRAIEAARRREPAPPPGFTASVMRRVAAVDAGFSAFRRWRRSRAAAATNFSHGRGVDPAVNTRTSGTGRFAREGVGVTKRVLWAIAAVGAVALMLSLWMGSPAVGPGTEATVGAAKRSVAPQANSVALGSMDVQQFLQSDTFDKLIRNNATRVILQKIAKDKALQDALSDPAIRAAFADPAFAEALSSPSFTEALAEPAFVAAMGKSSFHDALADPALINALADPAFEKAISDPALQKSLADPA